MMRTMWMTRVRLSLLAGALALGCSPAEAPATRGVMVILSTDLSSAEFDAVRVEVSQGRAREAGVWDNHLDHTYSVPGDIHFPTTLLVKAGDSPDQDALIEVTALLRGAPVVLREVELTLPTDRLAELRLLLAEACKMQVVPSGGEPESTCAAPGQSCQPDTGACASSAVPSSALPNYVPGDENLTADATTAQEAGPSGVADGAPRDAPGLSDASPEDASVTDGLVVDAPLLDAPLLDAPNLDEPIGIAETPTDAAPDVGPSCTDACAVGASRCDGARLQACVEGDGCAQWITATTCGTNQSCTIGVDGGGSCTCNATECMGTGQTCQDLQTVATCKLDGDGCLYVSETEACAAPDSCVVGDAGAACSPICTNTCTPGQAQCVSGAAGGLATCVLNPATGCYGYGPATACPAHQSCTGAPGSAACTCDNDPVCGHTTGTICASASSLVTCAQDPQGCFYESATTACAGGACGGTAGSACCTNACGGCATLTAQPGSACGMCGMNVCNGPGTAVTCSDPGLNACGGCGALAAAPNSSCGACGTNVCNGPGTAVTCSDPGLNACGGCGALAAAPSAACGKCGKYVCNAAGTAVTCSDPGLNACGGCGALAAAPNSSCGACGTNVCNGPGTAVTCSDPGLNACGGCGALAAAPNSVCQTCGTNVCNAAGTAVSCSGGGTNACGGCGALAAAPGSACGVCGTNVCNTAGTAVSCVECPMYTSITFDITTGSDDLRSDSSGTATLAINGAPQTFTLHAQNAAGWTNGSENAVSFTVAAVPLSAFGAITITLTSHNGFGETDDNWNVNGAHVTVSGPSGSACLSNGSGSPLFRLTGSAPSAGLVTGC